MAERLSPDGLSPEDIDTGITNTNGVLSLEVPSTAEKPATSTNPASAADESRHADITHTDPAPVAMSIPAVVIISGEGVSYTTNSAGRPIQSEPAGSTTPYHNSLQYWADRQKPVKERNLRLYRIIAIAAIIAFFPLGIPAFFHAMKIKDDFYEGIQKGDLSACNKRALLLHKLLILSFTMCLFTVILILAVVAGVEGEQQTPALQGVHL